MLLWENNFIRPHMFIGLKNKYMPYTYFDIEQICHILTNTYFHTTTASKFLKKLLIFVHMIIGSLYLNISQNVQSILDKYLL